MKRSIENCDSKSRKEQKHDKFDEAIQQHRTQQSDSNARYNKILELVRKLAQQTVHATVRVEDDIDLYSPLPFDVVLHILQFYQLEFDLYFLKARNEDNSLNAEVLTRLFFGYQEVDQHRQAVLLFPCIGLERAKWMEPKTHKLPTPIRVFPVETIFISCRHLTGPFDRFPQLLGLNTPINALPMHVAKLTKIQDLRYFNKKFSVEKMTNLTRLESSSIEGIQSLPKLHTLKLDHEFGNKGHIFENVLKLPALTSLDFGQTTTVLKLTPKLDFSRLKTLEIAELSLGDKAFTISHRLTRLVVFNLIDPDSLCCFLDGNTTIQSFCLYSVERMNEKTARMLANQTTITNLEFSCEMEQVFYPMIFDQTPILSNLKKLLLSTEGVPTPEIYKQVIRNIPQVTSLNLTIVIDSEDTKTITSYPLLTKLSLNNCCLDDQDASQFFLMTQLKELSIVRNNLTSDAIWYAMVNNSIQSLNIGFNTMITEEALIPIVKYNTTLTELRAQETKCSERFFDTVRASNRLVDLLCSTESYDIARYGLKKFSESGSVMQRFNIFSWDMEYM